MERSFPELWRRCLALGVPKNPTGAQHGPDVGGGKSLSRCPRVGMPLGILMELGEIPFSPNFAALYFYFFPCFSPVGC